MAGSYAGLLWDVGLGKRTGRDLDVKENGRRVAMTETIAETIADIP
jgi:hypothetical protein